MFPSLPGSIAHTISQLPNQIRRREKLWEISKIKKVYAFDLPFLKSTAALVFSLTFSSDHLLFGLANIPLPGSIAYTISQLPNHIKRGEKLREISIKNCMPSIYIF